jgi:hypothetical protein
MIQKLRVVVDIRGLNKIAVPDSYPRPRQGDIISATRGSKYITVVDVSSFFCQWPVHPDDHHKFAVNSHRSQEFFTVAVMGFRNSPPYSQRQIERIIGDRRFVKVYIDDSTIFPQTLEGHLAHIRDVFGLLSKNITMDPKIGFPGVTLLGHHVDGLGLITLEERVGGSSWATSE